MVASKVGAKELLPQKRYHKKNLDGTGTGEKAYCSGTTKKNMEELNIGISSKYLINTQLLIAEWYTQRTA